MWVCVGHTTLGIGQMLLLLGLTLHLTLAGRSFTYQSLAPSQGLVLPLGGFCTDKSIPLGLDSGPAINQSSRS
ncbi:hypothetical protein JAAARDRAFT_325515 [Jaapia argillacea MUCL 33604]|uniref:Uncharacterized protein n=1 Tax=Jaapia argillacea MUCL 33604 TaxID=933084 RepID=A0A067PLA2_9AGAM|nr:hypothetical protein JAAARDRAFT_325515 [Jaapia argillacea MUCL 33604]